MFLQKIANKMQIIDDCCKMLKYFYVFLCTFAKEILIYFLCFLQNVDIFFVYFCKRARLLAHCNAQGDNFILYKKDCK